MTYEVNRLHNSIYIKYKNRQNQSTLFEGRRVITLIGREGEERALVIGKKYGGKRALGSW